MTKLGRYTVEEELGRGSMGVVYLAHDPQIRRRVAVKTISLPDGLSESQRREYRARFLREAQAAGSLTHPGIVTIYGVEEVAGRDLPFITMEYVAGRNLQHILQTEGRLVPERALQMSMSLAEALQAAHAAGVIHRDIKPANILVRDKDGAVKITDFGVARVPLGDLTSGNGVLGSPSYMAPEQMRSGVADERSDLFALSVILYEAITGERLHGGDDLLTIADKVANRPVPSVTARVRGLPSSTDTFFRKALAKEPAERFPNAAAFREAINEILLEIELDRLGTNAPEMPFIVAEAQPASAQGRPGRLADPRVLAAAVTGVVLVVLAVLGGTTMLGPPPAGGAPSPAPAVEAAGPDAASKADARTAEPPPVDPAPVTAPGAVAPRTPSGGSRPGQAAPPKAPAKVDPPAGATQRRPTATAAPGEPAAGAEGSAEDAAAEARPLAADTDVATPPEVAISEVAPPADPLGAALPETGSVLLAVTSKVREGTLLVLVDGSEVYSRDLAATGKKFQRLVKKVTQAAHEVVEESIELPAGAHTITARLQIAGKPSVAEASVELDLAAGTTRTIEISAGRKFGLGDALHLRLGD